MKVCVKCRREMRCEKNEVGARFGAAHVYPGDKFKCPDCGMEILSCNTAPVHDPEGPDGFSFPDTIQMNGGER